MPPKRDLLPIASGAGNKPEANIQRRLKTVGPPESSSEHSRFQNGNNTKIVTKTKGKKKGGGGRKKGEASEQSYWRKCTRRFHAWTLQEEQETRAFPREHGMWEASFAHLKQTGAQTRLLLLLLLDSQCRTAPLGSFCRDNKKTRLECDTSEFASFIQSLQSAASNGLKEIIKKEIIIKKKKNERGAARVDLGLFSSSRSPLVYCYPGVVRPSCTAHVNVDR